MAYNHIKPEKAKMARTSKKPSTFGRIVTFFIGDDPFVRKMVVVVLLIITAIAGVVGYWTVTRPASNIPVFMPPPGPMKARPLDRGGMDLPDDELMDDNQAHSRVKLAPAPEAPNTKLLHQMIANNSDESLEIPEDEKASSADRHPSPELLDHNFSSLSATGWRVIIYHKDLSATKAQEVWKKIDAQEGMRLVGIKPVYFYKKTGLNNVAIALEGVATLSESNRLCDTAHGMKLHCDSRFVKKTR